MSNHNDIIIKSLGEICDINYGDYLLRSKMINGIYFVRNGKTIIGTHNQKNRDGPAFGTRV